MFVDSEEEMWNMSPEALTCAMEEAEASGQLPKAVIVVNLYGQSAKMDKLMSICDTYVVPMIEDADESLGLLEKGKKSSFIQVVTVSILSTVIRSLQLPVETPLFPMNWMYWRIIISIASSGIITG